MGLLLTIIALIMFFFIGAIGFIAGIFISLFTHSGDRYFKNIAKGIDIFGNVLCAPLFNIILIKNSNNKFGDWGETISSVIGKNNVKESLTKLGVLIYKSLNFIEKNHCEDSIKTHIK